MVPGLPEDKGSLGDIAGDAMRIAYYRHLHVSRGGKNEPRWRNVAVSKYPSDMILYAQVAFKRRPDYIIETGTQYGGSALFFGDLLMLTGGKKVISIDIKSWNPTPQEHPMVEYMIGSSTDPSIVEKIKNQLKGTVMVSLDSSHSTDHVSRELEIYSEIVSKGQYIVVEDCWTKWYQPYGPHRSVRRFLKTHKNFERIECEKQFIFAVTKDGWLFKKE